jgi:myo-inositol catabolism protein IolC
MANTGVTFSCTAEHPLLMLAADHRGTFERHLYGLTRPPAPAQAALISEDKLMIYQALIDAVRQLPSEARPGLLVDEQYGNGVASLVAATGGRISLAMPIEASGEQWLCPAYGKDWRAHAARFACDYYKVLVRDNPGLDRDQRSRQADLLAEISQWSADGDRTLLVEVLVPPVPDNLSAVGGDIARYEREVRPELMVAVIEYLQDRGVAPRLWKLQGLDRRDDALAVANAARRGGRNAECIVLGQHADHDKLRHWLRVAAQTPGFAGFAIGRSIWWNALHDRLHRGSTVREVRHRIGEAYLDFANCYLSAHDDSLARLAGEPA